MQQRSVRFALAGLSLLGMSTPALAVAPFGVALQLTVPVMCTVVHRPGMVAEGNNSYELGQLAEYCNAPHGYELHVAYAPGTLKGAVLSLGDDHIRLDGSGNATLSRATGPRVRSRAIVAAPGPDGFDTDRLNFDLRPS